MSSNVNLVSMTVPTDKLSGKVIVENERLYFYPYLTSAYPNEIREGYTKDESSEGFLGAATISSAAARENVLFDTFRGAFPLDGLTTSSFVPGTDVGAYLRLQNQSQGEKQGAGSDTSSQENGVVGQVNRPTPMSQSRTLDIVVGGVYVGSLVVTVACALKQHN